MTIISTYIFLYTNADSISVDSISDCIYYLYISFNIYRLYSCIYLLKYMFNIILNMILVTTFDHNSTTILINKYKNMIYY